MSSSSSTALNSNEEKKDWLELPSDVTANILKRIGVVNILENAQRVCTAWRQICKDPGMWRVIKMNILWLYERRVCKEAVDRSRGQLVDVSIRSCDGELLSYIADRSRQLRRLELIFFSWEVRREISGHLMKFPCLEELNLYSNAVCMQKDFIETAGRYCPMLKSLKVNHTRCPDWSGVNDNEVAIAIGKNLHELRHLELIGSSMTNIGLQAFFMVVFALKHLTCVNAFSLISTEIWGKDVLNRLKV